MHNWSLILGDCDDVDLAELERPRGDPAEIHRLWEGKNNAEEPQAEKEQEQAVGQCAQTLEQQRKIEAAEMPLEHLMLSHRSNDVDRAEIQRLFGEINKAKEILAKQEREKKLWQEVGQFAQNLELQRKLAAGEVATSDQDATCSYAEPVVTARSADPPMFPSHSQAMDAEQREQALPRNVQPFRRTTGRKTPPGVQNVRKLALKKVRADSTRASSSSTSSISAGSGADPEHAPQASTSSGSPESLPPRTHNAMLPPPLPTHPRPDAPSSSDSHNTRTRTSSADWLKPYELIGLATLPHGISWQLAHAPVGQRLQSSASTSTPSVSNSNSDPEAAKFVFTSGQPQSQAAGKRGPGRPRKGAAGKRSKNPTAPT
ncbi:hypothetical protein C8T65DRAFT_827660 [Cerioporus squamosus]|nr:hypothetical protein C8T65DRAFT_827660 [Cerioporus squamosus]